MDINTPEGMKAAVEWQTQLFGTLKEGGIWVAPNTGSVFQVFKSRKTVVQLARAVPDNSVRRVVEAMGWTYVERGQADFSDPSLS